MLDLGITSEKIDEFKEARLSDLKRKNYLEPPQTCPGPDCADPGHWEGLTG